MHCHASVAMTEKHFDQVVISSLRQYKTLIPYLVQSVPKGEWSNQEKKVVPLVRQIFKGHDGWEDAVSKLTADQKMMVYQNAGGVAAREGTRAHDFAEKILLGELKLTEIPKEFRDGVGLYTSHCQDIDSIDPSEEKYVEIQTPLFYDHKATGTADFFKPLENIVYNRDLKYGKGKFVSTERNPQLAIYSLSAIEWFERQDLFAFEPDTEVDMGIVQPRNREGEPIRSSVMTLHDLRQFGEEIGESAKAIYQGSTQFAASKEACQWCPVKEFCDHAWSDASEPIPGDDPLAFFENLETPQEIAGTVKAFDAMDPKQKGEAFNLHTLDTDTLVRIWANVKQIERFSKTIHDYLSFLVEGGLEHPDIKLCEGRAGNRFVKDEDSYIQFLEGVGFEEDEIYEKEPISLTKAEKMLGKAVNRKLKRNDEFDEELAIAFESLLDRAPGTPSVALASDKRPAITSKTDYFENLDEKELAEPEDIK